MIIIFLLFGLLTYYVIFDDAFREWERIVASDIDLTANISREIDHVVDNCFLMIDVLSNLSNYDDISKILDKNDSISSFMITDQDGSVVYRYYEDYSPEEQEILFERYILPWFQYPFKGERFVSNLIFDNQLPHELIAFGAPIIKENQVSGIAFITYKVDSFIPLLESYKVGKNGYVFIRDSLGNIIYHPQRELIRSRNYKFFDVPLVPKSDHKINQSSFDNSLKYMTYLPMKNAPWMVFVMKPIIEYQSPIITIFLKNGTIVLLLLIFLYLLYTLEKKEKRLLETQLNNERLEVAAQVAAGIAHEIKNPLVPIKGFIQLEKQKSETTLGSDIVQLLLDEINRIEKIINDFLTLTRSNRDELNIPVDIVKTLKDVITLMKVEAKNKGIVVLTNIEDIPEEIIVKGNRNHLVQIFQNIIKNSIEAEKQGGHIEVLVKKDKKEVRVSIKDTGKGMSAEQLRKIGTPFYSTKEQGTGMGIAICQRLVKNHGGRLNIISQEGKGTTVEIYLPIV